MNNKGDFVKNLLDIKNLKRKNALFIGNDENDIPAIEHVKFAVGVADSYETFYQSASYMLFKTEETVLFVNYVRY